MATLVLVCCRLCLKNSAADSHEDPDMYRLALLLSFIGLAGDAAAQEQPLRWTFSDAIPGELHGQAKIVNDRLQKPAYPTFEDGNTVLEMKSPSWIRFADDEDNTQFDFDNGDAITLEAWVRINSIGENVYLISKGRTGRSGFKAINQNWAFRLRKRSGQACVNFLFRSRKTDQHPGDWHRWTSTTGISSGSRWHHVAVSYRFGDPKTIRGFVDGRQVKGTWDMGGETTEPPVVDNDDVLIGSTMDGLKNNSLDGAIDNVAIHRTEVATEELISRFQWTPQPIQPPTIPKGKVVVQLFGPLSSYKEIPQDAEVPLLEWQQDEIAFTRVPQQYDSWGVRKDWGNTVLVRAWADLTLPAGRHRLLARSRGLSVLKIDGNEILRTPVQRNYTGAHGLVKDLPLPPVAGMRPAAMNDSEVIVDFESTGTTHRIQYDVIVGGPNYRMEFGECCVAVAPPVGMFQLLSGAGGIPLTDEGWQQFVDKHDASIAKLNRTRRQVINEQSSVYWMKRHQHTRETLLQNSEPLSIDELIEKRISQVNSVTAASSPAADTDPETGRFFSEHVQPIFNAHCVRCHAAKQQGGLLITDRARLLAGGESGQAAVVPHKPDSSYLLQLVSAPADDYRMPPKGAGLSDSEITVISKWIADGAGMPVAKSQTVEIPPLVDDHTFLRRIYLDTVGVPPTIAEVGQYFADSPEHRRSAVIDRLLTDDRWADNWVGYWQDALAENPNLLKPTLNNTGPFRYWIHDALTDNKSADRFATELIMMRGSIWGGGSAGFGVASQNDVPMAAKAHVISSAFLGINMKCARCHDAPYHELKQSDLFQMAAMLSRRDLKLPATSTVPAAFFEKQARKSLIEVSLQTGADIQAHYPFADLATDFPASLQTAPDDSRERLALQVTTSRRFAEVIANRVWKRLMGAALVDPVDDWEGNPPGDPELLATLADTLIRLDYDLKEFARVIFSSQAWQRKASNLPAKGKRYFAGPYRRRMSAEQVVDSAFHAVGQKMQTEMLTLDVEGNLPASRFLNFGYPQRSWEFSTLANERDRPSLALPKVQAVIDVLKAFGWRNSRPEPNTVREEAPNLIQPGVLANGTLGIWLTRLTDDSRLTQLMMQQQSIEELTEKIYLQLLTRKPTEIERKDFAELLSRGFADRVVPENEVGTPHEPRRFRYVSWSNHLNSEANVIKMQMQEFVRQGPPPTRYLRPEWRERAEDAVWSLLNSPEMILIP